MSLELELVTPAFLAGADQAKAEWRVPSIRGQLRFWLRAVAGLETQDPAELRRIEEGVFGSTGRQSPVSFRIAGRPPLWQDEDVSFGRPWSAERLAGSVREAGNPAVVQRLEAKNPNTGAIVPSNPLAYLGYGCLSWKGKPEPERDKRRGVLRLPQTIKLIVQWRPRDLSRPDLLKQAIQAWLGLGGLGAKARKGFGSLHCVGVDGTAGLGTAADLSPTSLAAFREQVQPWLRGPAARPNWSCFSAGARILISEDHGSWEDALMQAGAWLIWYRRRYGHPKDERVPLKGRDYVWMKPAHADHHKAPPDRGGFGLPLPFSKVEVLTWDDDRPGDARRASPLHLHVVRFGDRYHTVWTHLPARFLPAGRSVTFKNEPSKTFAPTPKQEGIVDTFLTQLATKELLTEVTP